MKKGLKILLIIGCVLFALSVVVNGIARYGWKLRGFDMCERPETLFVYAVDVQERSVRISGDTSSSASAYVGYTYVMQDDILYVGIKQNILLGFPRRIGAYDFTIRDDFSNLQAVYLRDATDTKCIWQTEAEKSQGGTP